MGGGSKKGGGGSVQFPKVDTNPPIDARTKTGFQTVETAVGDLSAYLNSILNPSLSLGNWAAEQATGGNAGAIPGINPNVQFPFGANTETGFYFPNVGDIPGGAGMGDPALSAEFAGPGYSGSSVVPGFTANAGVSGSASPVGGGGTTGMSPSMQPGGGATGAPVSAFLPGGNQQSFVSVGGGYYQEPGKTGSNYPYYNLYDSGSGWQGATEVAAPSVASSGTQRPGAGGAVGGGGGAPVDNRGPLLAGAENALAAETQIAGQTPPGLDPATIASLESKFFNNANPANIPGGTLPASGLYPDQQALIDTQTKSAQAATEQQLANEGLTSSTMGAELSGEIGQQGAAEAGTLIQGNLQIAQNAQQIAQGWAKLGMGEQTLGAAEQQQMFDFFSNISKQYAGLQEQMWGEAIQGYGVFSGFVNQLLSSYGLSTSQNADVMQAEAAQASDQASIESAQIASQAQQSSSASSMFGALGDLFGSSGGSGGLLGGLIGGGGAAAGAGAAAGGGSAIADIAPLVAGLFL